MKSILDQPDYNLVLVDSMNLTYRFFNAMKGLTYKGRPTGMLFGVMKFCVYTALRYPNARIVFLWEGTSSRRKSMYKEYKSKRASVKVPVSFWDCVDEVREVLPWFGVDQMWHIGLEADDMAGYMVECAQKDGKILLVSKDEDWMQYIRPGQVDIQRTSTIESFEDLQASYGYPPNKIGMWKILRGDVSDNIKGIKGIRGGLVRLLVNKCDNYMQFKDYPLARHNPLWEKWERILKEQWESVIERNADLILFHPEWIEPNQIVEIPGKKDVPKLKKAMEGAGIKSLLEKI